MSQQNWDKVLSLIEEEENSDVKQVLYTWVRDVEKYELQAQVAEKTLKMVETDNMNVFDALNEAMCQHEI